MPTFFREADYRRYLHLMVEACEKHVTSIWAYCLMPNHVHLIAVPSDERSLARAIGELHRRYSSEINRRQGWTGYLWQGRFSSFVMDERHLLAAARYVELNPVRAGLVRRALDYRWSSARAHAAGRSNRFVDVFPLLDLAGDWRKLLRNDGEVSEIESIRKHQRTGRPLGGEDFVARLEEKLDRALVPLKRGRKPRTK